MLRSTTTLIRSAISSLAKFTNKDEPAPWPSGAPSGPNGRFGLGVLRHAETTCRYSDKAGRRAVPGALRPKEIVHSRLNAVVHAGAQIDQPVGPFDQGGEDIGRENVDCENAGDARLRLDASRLAIADPRIVDHGVEAAEPIDLFGDALRAGDGREIA